MSILGVMAIVQIVYDEILYVIPTYISNCLTNFGHEIDDQESGVQFLNQK
jgi:hypothetical protein